MNRKIINTIFKFKIFKIIFKIFLKINKMNHNFQQKIAN